MASLRVFGKPPTFVVPENAPQPLLLSWPTGLTREKASFLLFAMPTRRQSSLPSLGRLSKAASA